MAHGVKTKRGEQQRNFGGQRAYRPGPGRTGWRRKDWEKKARRVRLLLLDVDGVLTDGRVVYDGAGRELKFFDIKDGLGIYLWQRAGLEVGILSGRKSTAVRSRAQELGIDLVRQKVRDKRRELDGILEKRGLRADQICFVGDDLVDLPLLGRVGLAVAVADGVDEVRAHAHYITRQPGGRGAVREVCELILRAQGKWEAATQEFFPPRGDFS